MNYVISRRYLAVSLMFVLFAGSLSATDKKGTVVPEKAVCVLNYQMKENSGNRLKDSSAFHNDAIAFGRPYTDIIKRLPQKDDLSAVKIGNSLADKTNLCGTFISHSDSLQPEKLIIDMNIKPLTASQSQNIDVFSGQITPFFYKKQKKGAECRTYYPIRIMLKKGNQIQLIPSLRDNEGKIKSAYTPAKKLEAGVFSNLRWIIDNNEVKLYLNGKLEYSRTLPGKIAYNHPDYYPGHVSFQFGSGAFDGLLGNLRIYDLDMAEKKKTLSIRISTNKPVNFFTQTEEKEFSVWIDNFSSEQIDGMISYNAIDDKGESIFHGEIPAILKPQQANLLKVICPSEKRGCFWLKCSFSKNKSIIASREESYAVGAIRDVSQFPASSPFGIHSAEPIGWGRNIPDIGMKWVRINLSRKYLEPEEGQYNWKLADEVVNYHFSQGREIMACLWGMPAWAVSEKTKKQILDRKEKIHTTRNYPPENWEKHKKYLREIITRYRNKINTWEVWNEANTGYCTATRWGKDLRPISKTELKSRQKNQEGFLSDFMRPASKDPANSKAADEYTVSNVSVRRMVLCLANGVDKTFIHPLGCWTYEKDLNRGNYRKGSDVLLPAIAWTTMVKKFCRAKFVRKIELQSANLYGYLFRKKQNGKNIAVFWCSRGIATVNINPDSATVKKYNIWGNPISLTTTKNSNFLSLSLSETPFYLEDVGNNIKPLKKALFIESPGFLVAGKNNNLSITVKNPLLRDISGKVVIKAPAGVVVEPDSYSLNLIVDGKEKRNIQVRPPSDLAGKECRFQASFNSPDVGGDEMETVICQVSRPAVPLSLRTDEIIVDGNADDNGWKQIKPLTVNREEQVVVGRPLCYGDKTTINKEKEWYGPDDLSADVYLSYDNKNLYLLAKVKDNDLTVNSRDRSPYTGDGLELFLDGRSEIKQANAQHTPGVCQLCLVPGDKHSRFNRPLALSRVMPRARG